MTLQAKQLHNQTMSQVSIEQPGLPDQPPTHFNYGPKVLRQKKKERNQDLQLSWEIKQLASSNLSVTSAQEAHLERTSWILVQVTN